MIKKRKIRRFAEGDEVDSVEGLGVFDPDTAYSARSSADIRGENIDAMSFKDAFKKKRKELGEGKTFSWRGNTYTTTTSKPKTEAELPKAAPPSRHAPVPEVTEATPSRRAPEPEKVATKPISAKQEESFGRRLGEGFLNLANRGMRAVGVPAQQRTFLTTLAGSKRPITEKDFSDEELAQLKFAADKAKKAGRKYITYDDYPNELLINKAEQFSKEQAMPQTVGRARLSDKDGKVKVTDIYDFVNSVREPEVKRYEKIREKEGKTGVAKQVAKEALEDYKKGDLNAAINKLPSRIGNAFIGREGRPVEINMRKGGIVRSTASRRADGIAQRGKTRGKFV